MCQCTPEIRTPWCGKPGCEPPPDATPPTGEPMGGVRVLPQTPRALTFLSASEGLSFKDFRDAVQRAQDHLDEHDHKGGEWARKTLAELAGHLLGHAKNVQFGTLAYDERRVARGDAAIDRLEREAAATLCRAAMVLERIRRLRTGTEEPRTR